MTTALLIHGGLWEDVNADFFWRAPGIVAGLERHGVRVLSPDRVPRAASWAAEAEHLAVLLPDHPVTVIAGSNGCSAAVRLALAALPSLPHNIVHQRRTVDALLNAVPQAVELPGCPEPPNPAFRAHAEAFVRTAATFVRTGEFQ